MNSTTDIVEAAASSAVENKEHDNLLSENSSGIVFGDDI